MGIGEYDYVIKYVSKLPGKQGNDVEIVCDTWTGVIKQLAKLRISHVLFDEHTMRGFGIYIRERVK